MLLPTTQLSTGYNMAFTVREVVNFDHITELIT
jgi:hypothetical protein